jgi:hypothetical protein
MFQSYIDHSQAHILVTRVHLKMCSIPYNCITYMNETDFIIYKFWRSSSEFELRDVSAEVCVVI